MGLTDSALLMAGDVSHGLFGRLERAAAASDTLEHRSVRVFSHPVCGLVGTCGNFQLVRADNGEGAEKNRFGK